MQSNCYNSNFSHQLRFDLSSPIIIPRGGENKSEINYLHHTFETQFAHKVSEILNHFKPTTVLILSSHIGEMQIEGWIV
jgi:hypothetical protein